MICSRTALPSTDVVVLFRKTQRDFLISAFHIGSLITIVTAMTFAESSPVIARPRDGRDHRSSLGPTIAVALTVIALGARWFLVIKKYSVNIFFMDQWDYLTLFFNQQTSIRHLFFWEHGPHREGVGLLPDKFLYPLTHWNARIDSFLIGAAILGAMLLALRLKCRLYGPLAYSDVAIPLIFLTMAQHETLLSVPNPAHSGFPLLMAMLYCLSLLARNQNLRFALILFLNFLLINTGFGIFMAGVTIGIFALECYWSSRHLSSVPIYSALAGLVLAVASLASFFFHYIFQSASPCFELPHNHWVRYPQFMGAMVAAFTIPRPFGVSNLLIFLGTLILMLMIAILIWHVLHLLKSPLPQTHLVGATLLGFSLLFAANTAVGRECMGVEQAIISRYGTLLIPAFLAVYFYLLSGNWYGWRNIVLALGVLALLPGSLVTPRSDIRWYSNGKRHWAECYIRTGDIRYCDQSTNFVLFPEPEKTHLQEKLDYLKENRLNLFAQPGSR